MTRRGSAVMLLLFGSLLPVALPQAQDKAPEDKELEALRAKRKDLIKLMEKLEEKLPPELARRAIIISMKLSTGFCSPQETKDFTADIENLPEGERKKFEKEWKQVREHPEYPCNKYKQTPATKEK